MKIRYFLAFNMLYGQIEHLEAENEMLKQELRKALEELQSLREENL